MRLHQFFFLFLSTDETYERATCLQTLQKNLKFTVSVIQMRIEQVLFVDFYKNLNVFSEQFNFCSLTKKKNLDFRPILSYSFVLQKKCQLCGQICVQVTQMMALLNDMRKFLHFFLPSLGSSACLPDLLSDNAALDLVRNNEESINLKFIDHF